MQARFLLGPAGSGKTFRCLAEIRRALLENPEGPPLLLLAPKQATFQLERQLLADGSLSGYTRLQILSFERLGRFILEELNPASQDWLDDEGRVMVLRALLAQNRADLRVFHATARLPGFATRLSLLLRELQRHQITPDRLLALSEKITAPPQLRDKLHDFAVILRGYLDWLQTHRLQDADCVLDIATAALRSRSQLSTFNSQLRLAGLWLDGFAEMTAQELALLAALVPRCDSATLAFCLETELRDEPPWLSTWSVIGQTFIHCRKRIADLPGVDVSVEVLDREPQKNRFSNNPELAHLEKQWAAPRVFNTEHGTRNTEHPIRLASCANPETEAILAAREILHFVRNRGRFREAAVLIRSLDGYADTLRRVFKHHEIPCFLDRREPVAHHPLAELTRYALRTVAFGWRQPDWFGALKTGLMPVPEEDIDRLENAALEHGWEGSAWQKPLVGQREGRDNLLLHMQQKVVHGDRLRQKLVPPFISLAQHTDTPLNGPQLAAAIREFWKSLDVEITLERWTSSAAEHSRDRNPRSAIHSTVWDQMNAWLENLERAFRTERLPVRDWLPVLEAGLSTLTVGVIPPALDQVLIGSIDRSRNPDLKLALVLGLNEGVFPARPAEDPLLTEVERDAMITHGARLGPGTRHRIGHEWFYGYIACTRASQRLVLTCATQDSDGQPLNHSAFFDHIERLFPNLKVEAWQPPTGFDEVEHLSEIIPAAIRLEVGRVTPCAPLGVSPAAGGAHGVTRPTDELLSLPELAGVLAKARQVANSAANQSLSPAAAELLYKRELATSVSALEDFAACPFKFFVGRGLRLEERKEFQFDDRDKGSFQHDVLRAFHQSVTNSGRRWRDLTSIEAAELVANIGRELLPAFEGGKFLADGTARFTGGIMIERLRRLMTALVEWMPQYGFDPVVCEAGFDDEKGELPSWRLDLGDGQALVLRGRIDRVDLRKVDEHTALAVVMDYKSRIRKLDATKLHHGLELQLLSYLAVLKHLRLPESTFGMKQLTPAGVFYVPLNGGGKTGASRENILAAGSDERRAEYQHSGRFLADQLEHFDNRHLPKGDQFKYSKNKDGSFSARGNDAMPAAEFEAMREKIEEHLRDYGRRIFAGEVNVSPFRIGNATACDYCEFRAVCRFDPWTQPFRTLTKPKKRTKG